MVLATLQADDGEVAHAKHPETYWIPPLVQRSKIKIGDYAKLRFLSFEEDGVTVTGERMWVEVEALANDPVTTPALTFGDVIWFEPRHIIDIQAE